MSDFREQFSPGYTAWMRVEAMYVRCTKVLILECLGPGIHRIGLRDIDTGEWFEYTTESPLWIRKYPAEDEGEIDALLWDEWLRIEDEKRDGERYGDSYQPD